jgi:renalase
MKASKTKPPVAIVGAGIAGLAAARQLSDAGMAVTVFEKSGDIGGRMATRTLGTMTFDHGVPSFGFKAPAFRDVAASWRPAVASWGPAGTVGVPDVKAPARILAAGLTIIKNQTVMSFAGQANSWTLTLSTGERIGQFSAIHEARVPSDIGKCQRGQSSAECRARAVYIVHSANLNKSSSEVSARTT